MMRSGIVRIQFERPLKRALCSGPVPIVIEVSESQRCVCFGYGGINLQRRSSRTFRFRHRLPGWNNTVEAEQVITVGEPGVCQRIGTIFADGVLKILDGFLEPFARPLVPMESPFQIEYVGLRVGGVLPCYELGLVNRELEL